VSALSAGGSQIKSNHFISGIVAHSRQTDRYT